MWERIEVSGVSRPILQPNEKDVAVESNVGIYQGKYKATDHQIGRVYLTTHRICYVDDAQPQTHSVALDLSSVKSTDYYAGFFKSSPKITLFLNGIDSNGNGTPKPSTPAPQSQPASQSITWVCQICYFSNSLADPHNVSTLPKCLTCGIQAERSQIDEAALNAGPKSTINTVRTRNNGDGFPCPRCTFENHPLLTQCEMCGEVLMSPRLPPALQSTRADSPAPSIPLIAGADGLVTKLSFRGNSTDKRFYEQLQTVLKERRWRRHQGEIQKKLDNKPSPAVKRITTGLHGLDLVNEQTRQSNEQVLGGALEDLQSLMNRAKEVIQLAESYALHLEKEEQQDESLAARKALRLSSDALGLKSSVVTKEGSSSNDSTFHQELAREIAEFLQNGVLDREGGVVSVVDLFAIYNRARGISLISPRDFHAACSQFERLRLPITLRKFKSGLLVVQESYKTIQVIIRNLLEWMRKQGRDEDGVSPQDVSAKFGWSVTVAVEELEMAEQHGALCRDEQISGVRFFENTIVQYVIN